MTRKDSFFVTGGPVGRNSLSYVERQADTDLYNALREGTFCYVLTPRQMGKSSLVVRTSARLRGEGFAVAVLDLTIIGQSASAEQWYRSILRNIGEQLKLENEVLEFWRGHPDVGALDRLMQAIQKIILKHLAVPITIFIDEVDYVRSMPFSTGEFFAAIRALYNKRATDESLENLTFCLLGVASLSDLIEDRETTPFNIGEQIELTDFKEQEAAPLIQGLGYHEQLGTALLQRVLHWTGGHPYLTQRLCQAVADDSSVADVSDVDHVCRSLFLSNNARISDKNLVFVRDSILESKADRASLLDLYGRVHSQTHSGSRFGEVFSSRMARVYRFLRGYMQVRDDETNPLVTVLRLSGITRVVGDELAVRNRIYYTVFDRRWISANMPDQEKSRQRAAFIRGALRIGGLAVAVLLVVGSLALAAYRGQQDAEMARSRTAEALKEVENQRNEAQKQRTIADEKAAEAEIQRARAEEAAKQADVARKMAEAGKLEADKQRQIAETQRGAALRAKAETEAALQEARRRVETVRNYQNGVDQYFKGNQTKAIEHFSNALNLYNEQIKHDKSKKEIKDDQFGKAITLTNIAAAYTASSNYTKAIEQYNKALAVYEGLKDLSGEAYTHMKIGQISLRGKYEYLEYGRAIANEKIDEEAGLKELRVAQRIYEQSKNMSGAAQALTLIAEAYYSDQPRYREKVTYAAIKKAVDAYDEAITAYLAAGDLPGKSNILNTILSLYDKVRRSGNDYDRNKYRYYLNELNETYRQIGYLNERIRTLIQFIEESNTAEKEQEALNSLKELLQEYQKSEYFSKNNAAVYQSLVSLANKGNNDQRAEIINFLKKRLQEYQQNKKYSEEVKILNSLGQIYYKAGDKTQALNYYNKALEVPPQISEELTIAHLSRVTGHIYYTSGDKLKALLLYTKALKGYQQANNIQGEIDSLQYIGELYYSMGDTDKSLESFNQVVNLFLKDADNKVPNPLFNRNSALYYSARAIGDIYKERGEEKKRSEFYNQLFSNIFKKNLGQSVDVLSSPYLQVALMSLYVGDKQAFSRYLTEFVLNSKEPMVGSPGANANTMLWLLAANEKEQALKLFDWYMSKPASNVDDPYYNPYEIHLLFLLISDEVRERGILNKIYERNKAQGEKEMDSDYGGSSMFNLFGDRKRANEVYLSSPPKDTSTSNTMAANISTTINTNTTNRPRTNSSTNTSSANVSSKP